MRMQATDHTTQPESLDALALMAAFILEDGRTWGEAAQPWQREDVAAVLQTSDGSPRRHYWLRGRGMSKTTDGAAVTLSLLLVEAPPRARIHVYAADAEQAGRFMDALAGIVGRTPGLPDAVELGARSATVRANGASLAVETSDGASAYGTRPWLTVVDELGVWPSTTNHRRLWGAIVSAVPKVPGSRLLVIGTAGSPVGLGATVWGDAEQSPHWRAVRRPGPSPWWSADDVDAVQADLTASDWRRLILCEWSESDDALSTTDDVEACIRAGSSALAPVGGVEYVAALDVGTRRDLTALVVGHSERRDAGRVVVIDRVLTWRPGSLPSVSADRRVDLAEVEAATLRLCRQYRVRGLRFDRMQAEQLTANLARQGIRTDEFVFSASGANRLARALYGALRDRALDLPDDAETREEFLSVRMVETGPATVKLQNPPGTHDDIVTAVGMVVVDLVERGDPGRASITVPRGTLPKASLGRTAATMRRSTQPPFQQVIAAAARRGPRIPGGGIVGVPGDYRDLHRQQLW
jgi:hypothetical protein